MDNFLYFKYFLTKYQKVQFIYLIIFRGGQSLVFCKVLNTPVPEDANHSLLSSSKYPST